MDIAIIGAGAAGCFAAANIPAGSAREVIIFEKTGKVLQKVKASGGGRCNVTHHCYDVPELLLRYPRGKQLLRRSLYQLPPQEVVAWFAQRGVHLKTEDDGRMFPITDSSQTIIDCLWEQLQQNGVQVRYNKAVTSIVPAQGGIVLHFADGTQHTAQKVLVATGGFPKAEQYQWLIACGHTIQAPVPSLFTFNVPGNPVTELMGVSVPMVSIRIAGSRIQEEGPILITHWGFSGPAVLRTSAFAARELAERNYTFNCLINWLHEADDHWLKNELQQLRQEAGKQQLGQKNPFGLPRRLWDFLIHKAGAAADTRWGELSASSQNKLVECLLRDTYSVKGKTTFK
ncbi:MAG: aminoacetone oxidase family FAD-binding enzyme, partial [Chitinophagia bacterium]|nr:aminoacetone oxidase family FAD-binding enzyme [Chitinophagia bacterium]